MIHPTRIYPESEVRATIEGRYVVYALRARVENHPLWHIVCGTGKDDELVRYFNNREEAEKAAREVAESDDVLQVIAALVRGWVFLQEAGAGAPTYRKG